MGELRRCGQASIHRGAVRPDQAAAGAEPAVAREATSEGTGQEAIHRSTVRPDQADAGVKLVAGRAGRWQCGKIGRAAVPARLLGNATHNDRTMHELGTPPGDAGGSTDLMEIHAARQAELCQRAFP
jgi:hypothetical protein